MYLNMDSIYKQMNAIDDSLSLLYEEMDYTFKLLDSDQFFALFNDKNVIDNQRFDIEAFRQSKDHFYGFICAFKSNALAAAALLRKNVITNNDIYIFIMQSLIKGAGRILLNHILDSYANVWLMSSPGDFGLIQYYDSFSISKFVLAANKSVFNTDTSFYHNFEDNDLFEKAVYKYYGKNLVEDLKQNIKGNLFDLGIFKYCDVENNEYLFKDDKKNNNMVNFIRISIDEPRKVLTIHGFSIEPKYKGFGLKTVQAILNNLDSSWLVQLENNLNPTFWQHIHDKYFKDYKFISVEK